MKRWPHAMKKSSRKLPPKQKWNESVGEIEAIIENSGIDRRKFNRGNQANGSTRSAPGRRKRRGYQLPDALEKFSQRFLIERTKADGIVPEHPLFVAIEACWLSH
jgi:exodeoxyribonuclease V beta subunit